MTQKKKDKIRSIRISDKTWKKLNELKDNGKSWERFLNEIIWEITK